jgi:hypothetical protein
MFKTSACKPADHWHGLHTKLPASWMQHNTLPSRSCQFLWGTVTYDAPAAEHSPSIAHAPGKSSVGKHAYSNEQGCTAELRFKTSTTRHHSQATTLRLAHGGMNISTALMQTAMIVLHFVSPQPSREHQHAELAQVRTYYNLFITASRHGGDRIAGTHTSHAAIPSNKQQRCNTARHPHE